MYSGNGEQESVIYETHAETACMWEHRIRAKWVQILHSADNMALPISRNKTMAQVADSLDTQAVSAVLVPTCRESFPLAAADEYYWISFVILVMVAPTASSLFCFAFHSLLPLPMNILGNTATTMLITFPNRTKDFAD
jgi:hypothetical protein